MSEVRRLHKIASNPYFHRKIKRVIPQELTQFFDAYDYEDLNLCITNVHFDGQPIVFDFLVQTAAQGEEDAVRKRWRVEVVGVREIRVSLDYGEKIAIRQDHPLLWKFTDWQCNLYFSGRCTDPTKLFYQMYHIHASLYKSYVPFEEFLNLNNFEQLFQLQGGLIAKGPRQLLEQYAKCLEEQGLGWSIVNGYRPTFWDGHSHQPEPTDLQILLIDQTYTYVIAEDFIFSPLAE